MKTASQIRKQNQKYLALRKKLLKLDAEMTSLLKRRMVFWPRMIKLERWYLDNNVEFPKDPK